MTLTINPSTSIRPLGEEHLGMFRRVIGTQESAPKIALPKGAYGLPRDLPKPESESILTACGRKYIIFRYGTKERPNLQQTIEIAEYTGLQMLTSEEARAIKNNDEFRNALKPGEWGYVRDSESERKSGAAWLYLNDVGELGCFVVSEATEGAKIVVLKGKSD